MFLYCFPELETFFSATEKRIGSLKKVDEPAVQLHVIAVYSLRYSRFDENSTTEYKSKTCARSLVIASLLTVAYFLKKLRKLKMAPWQNKGHKNSRKEFN